MAMRPTRPGRGGPSRPPRGPVRPIYEEFKPMSERHQEEDAEKLLIYLPGFMKETIKVSTEGKNTVRVRGERLVAGNKWNRFQEDFQAPEDCNMRGINAKFENGILTITMPRKIPKKDETLTTPTPTQPTPQKYGLPPKTTSPITETPRNPTPLNPTSQLLQNPQKSDDKDQDSRGTKEEQKEHDKESVGQLGSSIKPINAKWMMPVNIPDLEYKHIPSEPKLPKGLENFGLPTRRSTPLAKTSDDKKILEGEDQQKSTQLLKSSKEVVKEVSNEAKDKKGIEKSKESRGEVQEKVELKKSKENQSTSNLADSTSSSSAPGSHFGIDNLKKGLIELNEERQLLVNAGVAVLVIVAFGAYVYNSVSSGRAE